MDWSELQSLLDDVPVADTYRLEPLRQEQVARLMSSLRTWYPDVRVGAASCQSASPTARLSESSRTDCPPGTVLTSPSARADGPFARAAAATKVARVLSTTFNVAPSVSSAIPANCSESA